MTDFKDLFVWRRAKTMAKDVYVLTKDFPSEEKFGITNQMRRAAVSVSTNIAEGCGQGTDPGFKKFLHIAFGSACEVESLCYISIDLGFLIEKNAENIFYDVVAIKKMLSTLIKKIEQRVSDPEPS